jgi:hypothetical protein
MPDAIPDRAWPPAWTIAPPPQPGPPMIALDRLVKDRVRELAASLVVVRLMDRDWPKEPR